MGLGLGAGPGAELPLTPLLPRPQRTLLVSAGSLDSTRHTRGPRRTDDGAAGGLLTPTAWALRGSRPIAPLSARVLAAFTVWPESPVPRRRSCVFSGQRPDGIFCFGGQAAPGSAVTRGMRAFPTLPARAPRSPVSERRLRSTPGTRAAHLLLWAPAVQRPHLNPAAAPGDLARGEGRLPFLSLSGQSSELQMC